MKVLVTGAAGFLGRSVTRSLKVLGMDIAAVVRQGDGLAERVVCDVADPGALCRVLDATRPACVVNLAAISDFSAGVLPRLYPVNTLAPAILANYCRANGAHLVQASTIAIHERRAARIGPDTPGSPETDYGRSKWLAEQAISASGCRSTVIRFGGIFGSDGPDHLGLNRAIRQARAGDKPTMVGQGSARRNYIYVEDAAAVVTTCVRHALTGVFYAAGETMTIRGMLQAICDLWLPGEVPRVVDGDEAEDQVVAMSAALGSPRSFREALEDAR